MWFWILMLISFSIVGKSHYDDYRQAQVRQQRQIELDSIALAQNKLSHDMDSYRLKYRALFAQKAPLTSQEKVGVQEAERELKAIRARTDAMSRRVRALPKP